MICIIEAKSEMTDTRLLQYVQECVKTLADAGFDATMDDIECKVSAATRTFGTMQCKNMPDGKHTLTLSSYLKDEPEDAIKNTIYHELCHYLQYKYLLDNDIWYISPYGGKLSWGKNATRANRTAAKSHGSIWKNFANRVSRLTGQTITRTNTYDLHKDVGKAYDDKVKYIVKCENCGNEIKYTRKTEFVKTCNEKRKYLKRDPEKGLIETEGYRWRCGHCKTAGGWKVIEVGKNG